MITDNKINVWADGGARGNPGPAAIGVIIQSNDGSVRKSYAEYIGVATNNEAEYQAAIFALKKIKLLIGKDRAKKTQVNFTVDSELLEKQMNGKYKIKDSKLAKLFVEVWNLKLDFLEVLFKHAQREENKAADKLVNAALDKELNRLV